MKRILLVDDDPGIRRVLMRHFRHYPDWEVTPAINGVDAMRLVAEQTFDLAIVDVFMPEMDGIETVIEFRQAHPELRIVAISGGGSRPGMEPLQVARMLGADAALQKPFDFASLSRLVRSLLEDTRAA